MQVIVVMMSKPSISVGAKSSASNKTYTMKLVFPESRLIEKDRQQSFLEGVADEDWLGQKEICRMYLPNAYYPL